MNVLYININGLYGIREKDREKLRNCVDDEYCSKNAESICDRILDSQNIEKSLKYLKLIRSQNTSINMKNV